MGGCCIWSGCGDEIDRACRGGGSSGLLARMMCESQGSALVGMPESAERERPFTAGLIAVGRSSARDSLVKPSCWRSGWSAGPNSEPADPMKPLLEDMCGDESVPERVLVGVRAGELVPCPNELLAAFWRAEIVGGVDPAEARNPAKLSRPLLLRDPPPGWEPAGEATGPAKPAAATAAAACSPPSRGWMSCSTLASRLLISSFSASTRVFSLSAASSSR